MSPNGRFVIASGTYPPQVRESYIVQIWYYLKLSLCLLLYSLKVLCVKMTTIVNGQLSTLGKKSVIGDFVSSNIIGLGLGLGFRLGIIYLEESYPKVTLDNMNTTLALCRSLLLRDLR